MPARFRARRPGDRVIRRRSRFSGTLALGLLGAWLQAGSAQAAAPTVILLSWDGTRWDYPDRTALPGLERLAREGVRAGRMIPVFPSSTFPNHVSLATGARVDRHGIVANAFDDPDRGSYRYSADAGFIDAEPIWVTAERQGIRTATFFWVGSETDWRGRGATHRRAPFDADVDEATKVDQILAWLDLPESERPQLIASWWHGADTVGHREGPDGSGVAEQLRAQDAQLQRLLAGLDARRLWPSTTLLVVSDHGMASATREIDVLEALESRDVAARIQSGGAFGYLSLQDPARAAEAADLLDAVEGLRAWPSAALPMRLRARHPTRTGEVTVLAEPPYVIRPGSPMQATLLSVARSFGIQQGVHGYDPDHPEMHAIFFAAGRCIPPGWQLDSIEVVDVAPTLSALLGIEAPQHAEGRSRLPATCPRTAGR